MASSYPPANPPESSASGQAGGTGRGTTDAASLLELLGDEYTQRILAALGDEVLTGRELIERADVSKATAYRRLDDLQEADLVESTLRIDPDGHHCEEYHLAATGLAISLDPEGFEVTVDVAQSESLTDRSAGLFAPADD